MVLTLSIKFYEPFSGALMTGKRKLYVADFKDAELTKKRYAAYFKDTYGSSAEVVVAKIE